MPEPPTTEPWKGVTPIANFKKPFGSENLYVPDVSGDDEALHWMPMGKGGLSARAMWISPERNMWVHILKGQGGRLVNRHYHPTPVWAYTLSGKWGYLEHEWTARAGDFVYEPPGGSHTLVMYDCPEPTAILFFQTFPLVWLDEQGKQLYSTDIHDVLEHLEAHYAGTSLGRDYVKTLIR
jgi:2,4'-dihydroxyacetophenone dioxygenase